MASSTAACPASSVTSPGACFSASAVARSAAARLPAPGEREAPLHDRVLPSRLRRSAPGRRSGPRRPSGPPFPGRGPSASSRRGSSLPARACSSTRTAAAGFPAESQVMAMRSDCSGPMSSDASRSRYARARASDARPEREPAGAQQHLAGIGIALQRAAVGGLGIGGPTQRLERLAERAQGLGVAGVDLHGPLQQRARQSLARRGRAAPCPGAGGRWCRRLSVGQRLHRAHRIVGVRRPRATSRPAADRAPARAGRACAPAPAARGRAAADRSRRAAARGRAAPETLSGQRSSRPRAVTSARAGSQTGPAPRPARARARDVPDPRPGRGAAAPRSGRAPLQREQPRAEEVGVGRRPTSSRRWGPPSPPSSPRRPPLGAPAGRPAGRRQRGRERPRRGFLPGSLTGGPWGVRVTPGRKRQLAGRRSRRWSSTASGSSRPGTSATST